MNEEKGLNKETVAQDQTLITLLASLNVNAKLSIQNIEKRVTLPE